MLTAALLLGGLVVLMVLLTMVIWIMGNARLRWRQKLYAAWESVILEYLCQESDEERHRIQVRLNHEIRPLQQPVFGDFVLEYLGDLRGEDAESLQSLLRVLGYDHRAVRELRSRSPWKRARAARLLGEMRATGAEDRLVEALRDPSALVTFAAAIALIQIGGAKGMASVAEAITENPDWNVGQIKTLSSAGGNALAERLHVLLESRKLEIGRTKTLVELIGAFRYLPACGTLLRLLRAAPAVELRISLLRSLGKLELDEAFPDALAALEDANWVVRSQAALALGRLGNPDAVPRLVRCLEDGSYWVRYNAALSLRGLGAGGRAALQGIADQETGAAELAREVIQSGRTA